MSRLPDNCPNCDAETDAHNTETTHINGVTSVVCGECGADLTPDTKVNYKSPVEPQTDE